MEYYDFQYLSIMIRTLTFLTTQLQEFDVFILAHYAFLNVKYNFNKFDTISYGLCYSNIATLRRALFMKIRNFKSLFVECSRCWGHIMYIYLNILYFIHIFRCGLFVSTILFQHLESTKFVGYSHVM